MMATLLPVRHLEQKSNWDCGVTCLRMLIDFFHLDISSFDCLLCTYQCNNSTWTIDLLHLLHQSGIDATLHTITIGCSPAYTNVLYYERLIDKDQERVNKLFETESAYVKLGSLQWSELRAHLQDYRIPCLVLVDAHMLQCCTCKSTIFNRLLNNFVPSLSSSYQGHYVLVIGYIITDKDEFVRYVDPGKSDGFCTTTRENFDRARTAFGTDEDVILCFPLSTTN